MSEPKKPENPPVRSAIILAAGRGSRLGGEEAGMCKALLDVGGETILRYQVRRLRECGVVRLAVVTGFLAEAVREHLAGETITWFHNPDYATTNSLHSLLLARDHAIAGTLVLNCDVIFHADLLRRLLADPGPNAILVDFESELGDEEMKVRVTDGLVTAISKDIPGEPGMGENLGIIRIGARDSAAFFACAEGIIKAGEARAWAPHCIQRLVGRVPFRAVPTGGLPWTEIDFPEDLAHARRNIHPLCADLTRN